MKVWKGQSQQAVICLLALGLLTGCGLAPSDGTGRAPSGQESRKENPASGASLIGRPEIDKAAERHLPLFRTSPERIPQHTRRISHGWAMYELNWEAAQRVPVPFGPRIWATLGRKVICLLSEEIPQAVGATCGDGEEVLKHGLATTLLAESGAPPRRVKRLIVGIAPSNTEAVVAIAPGNRTKIPVVGGVFVGRDHVMNPPDRFELVGP